MTITQHQPVDMYEQDVQTFTTRNVPWMKLGTVIDEPVDAATAARLGGLDFTVSLRPSGYRQQDGTWRENGRHDVVADDTGESFDTATDDYKVVQFGEAFDFLDKIGPKYVAAGSMKHRKQGFIVMQVPGVEHLALDLKGEKDPHELYVVSRTSHDRSRGLEVAILPLRDKCMNQLGLATFAQGAPQKWSIRHVGDPHSKLAAATNTLRNVHRYAEEYTRLAERFVEQDLLIDEVEQILREVLPDRPKRDDQVNAIVKAWRNDDEHVGFSGTGWGLIQATGEYFEWGRDLRNRTPQSRFLGGLEGDTAKRVNGVARALRLRQVRRAR